MKLEQKQPTKSPEERRDDVLEALALLSYMPKFPETARQLEFLAKVIASFCETVEVNHGSKESPRRGDLGWVVPLQWLVEEIASTCTFFPAPVQMRQIYETKFTPLDGRDSTNMRATVDN